MVGSAGRSTRVSIRSSLTSMGREKISSCGDTNSAITSSPDSGSSTTSGSGSRSGSSTVMLSRIFFTPARISLYPATSSLKCGLLRCEHTKYEDLIRQINLDIRYDCLFTTNKLSQPVLFGHSCTSVQMSGKITEEFFKMIFFTRIHNDHENPKNAGQSCTYHVPLPSHQHQCLYNFHKSKILWINFQCIKSYPRINVLLLSQCCKIFPLAPRLNFGTNASNRARNRLRTGQKRLLDCCAMTCWAESGRGPNLELGCEDCRRVVLTSTNLLLRKRLDSHLKRAQNGLRKIWTEFELWVRWVRSLSTRLSWLFWVGSDRADNSGSAQLEPVAGGSGVARWVDVSREVADVSRKVADVSDWAGRSLIKSLGL